jgi:hypothetical protein
MTSTERSRRFLDKIRGTGPAPAPQSSELEAECANLKSECAKLKAENANLKRFADGAMEQCAKLEARLKRPRPEPKAKPIRTQSEIEQQLRRKINELRTQLRVVQYSRNDAVFLKRGDRRKILSALHPDSVLDPAVKRRLEIAFQIINDLFESKQLMEIGEDER